MEHEGAISGTLAYSLRSYLAPTYRIAIPSLRRLPEIDLLFFNLACTGLWGRVSRSYVWAHAHDARRISLRRSCLLWT